MLVKLNTKIGQNWSFRTKKFFHLNIVNAFRHEITLNMDQYVIENTWTTLLH